MLADYCLSHISIILIGLVNNRIMQFLLRWKLGLQASTTKSLKFSPERNVKLSGP